MTFINKCHLNNIGVILDFVPVHFVRDNFSLSKFDGSFLYEYEFEDIANNEWGSCNFNYYNPTVVSFLMSSATFWLEIRQSFLNKTRRDAKFLRLIIF
jgi:1,4-alpha-glucan branching enzyme